MVYVGEDRMTQKSWTLWAGNSTAFGEEVLTFQEILSVGRNCSIVGSETTYNVTIPYGLLFMSQQLYSGPVPSQQPEKASEHGPSAWAPVIHMGNLEKAPGSSHLS